MRPPRQLELHKHPPSADACELPKQNKPKALEYKCLRACSASFTEYTMCKQMHTCNKLLRPEFGGNHWLPQLATQSASQIHHEWQRRHIHLPPAAGERITDWVTSTCCRNARSLALSKRPCQGQKACAISWRYGGYCAGHFLPGSSVVILADHRKAINVLQNRP